MTRDQLAAIADTDRYVKLNAHGITGITSYAGSSSLGTLDVARYAMVSLRRPPRIDRACVGRIKSSARQELIDQCLASGGVLDLGGGVHLRVSKSGMVRRRNIDMDDARRALKQAAHDQRWQETGPHYCQCGCGTVMAPGHFDSPIKRFERGHNSTRTGRQISRQKRAA